MSESVLGADAGVESQVEFTSSVQRPSSLEGNQIAPHLNVMECCRVAVEGEPKLAIGERDIFGGLKSKQIEDLNDEWKLVDIGSTDPRSA